MPATSIVLQRAGHVAHTSNGRTRSQCGLAAGLLPHKKRHVCHAVTTAPLLRNGPTSELPDYSAIDAVPFNKWLMEYFRSKVEEVSGERSDLQGYGGVVELVQQTNFKSTNPVLVQQQAQKVLDLMFPAWLLPLFKDSFARYLPELSNVMCAYVTVYTFQWLMGPMAINEVDVKQSDGTVQKLPGVKIDRCRYLEASECISVCVNSCKVPTQSFFKDSMGLDVTLTPNYEDFSCQFTFGQKPLAQDLDDAFKSPCFMQCPSKRRADHRATLPNCHKV